MRTIFQILMDLEKSVEGSKKVLKSVKVIKFKDILKVVKHQQTMKDSDVGIVQDELQGLINKLKSMEEDLKSIDDIVKNTNTEKPREGKESLDAEKKANDSKNETTRLKSDSKTVRTSEPNYPEIIMRKNKTFYTLRNGNTSNDILKGSESESNENDVKIRREIKRDESKPVGERGKSVKVEVGERSKVGPKLETDDNEEHKEKHVLSAGKKMEGFQKRSSTPLNSVRSFEPKTNRPKKSEGNSIPLKVSEKSEKQRKKVRVFRNSPVEVENRVPDHETKVPKNMIRGEKVLNRVLGSKHIKQNTNLNIDFKHDKHDSELSTNDTNKKIIRLNTRQSKFQELNAKNKKNTKTQKESNTNEKLLKHAVRIVNEETETIEETPLIHNSSLRKSGEIPPNSANNPMNNTVWNAGIIPTEEKISVRSRFDEVSPRDELDVPEMKQPLLRTEKYSEKEGIKPYKQHETLEPEPEKDVPTSHLKIDRTTDEVQMLSVDRVNTEISSSGVFVELSKVVERITIKVRDLKDVLERIVVKKHVVRIPKSTERKGISKPLNIRVKELILEHEKPKRHGMGKIENERELREIIENTRHEISKTRKELTESKGKWVYRKTDTHSAKDNGEDNGVTSRVLLRNVHGHDRKFIEELSESNIKKLQSTLDDIVSKIDRGSVREKATVHLEPPRLGRVEIEVVKEDNKLRVEFKVSSPEVKNMLEKRLDNLASRLESGGFNVEKIEVKFERFEDNGRYREENDDENPKDQGGYEPDGEREEKRRRQRFQRILNWERGDRS